MDQLSAFLHTPAWERFQTASGAVVQREQNELYIERSIPRGTYWQSSRCAISTEWKVPDFAKEGWFLRLDPDSTASYKALEVYSKKNNLLLCSTSAYQPRQTAVVDISQSEEEILSHMKSKHRYNIRLAEKHSVEVEVHSENLQEYFPRFAKLLKETTERQQFRAHSEDYYQKMLAELEKDGMVHLLFASYEGQDLATILLITNGSVATYLHGASTFSHKEMMAPYLLHWTAIRFAKARSCTQYDLWGTHAIKDESGDWTSQEGHPSAGTTRFKLGFGGTVIEYPGTYDLVLRQIPYRLYNSIRSIRSRKRAFS